MIHRILAMLGALPGALIYVVLGAGAAVENVFPPVPADTFVLVGAFLAARGAALLWLVFLVTWVGNVASALVVYVLARRYGRAFFNRRVGHWLLQPRQLEQISLFYDRWGELAIIMSRFLPGFRATVPVFAGVTHLSFPRVAFPVAMASAVWYGALVFLGSLAGRNLDWIARTFSHVSGVLLWVALGLLLLVGAWWWLTRRRKR
ncbi:MAG: DedA family protein [Gemmatimonadota bacterium]